MTAQVLDLELSDAPEVVSVHPHREAFVLVRVSGHPVGTVRVACPDRVLTRERLVLTLSADAALVRRVADRLALEAVTAVPGPQPPALSWTAAVCSRDRPEMLRRCVKSLLDLDPAPEQVVVVDNASATDETRRVAQELGVHYVGEPQPGLNRARRRAVAAATGEVVLFTDDDVVVDRYWARGLVEPFADPRVGAVTGLTLPLELENASQEFFEQRGGFGRGFVRRDVDFRSLPPIRAGSLGAGANMAFRHELVSELGLFDADLDCGTPARTGGDSYAFYRLLRSGRRLVYTPDALAWHQHRSDAAALRSTLQGYSTGAYTWMLMALIEDRDPSALRSGYAWFKQHHARRLAGSLLKTKKAAPMELTLAELRGVAAAPRAYLRTRRARP